jgi:hypothetical protein
MGFGDALDAASQMLAGGENTAGKPTSGKPIYTKASDIDPPDSTVGGSTAPNLPQVQDRPAFIEFIHFGYVHPSKSSRYSHPSYADNKAIADLPKDAKPRGVQFRSALEREIILLSGFMQATQSVLDERDKDKGALGGALDTVGSLTGMSGGGSGGSKSSDLNSYLAKIKSAAGTINVTPVEYKNIHQAGLDLHQARADYRAFLGKLKDEKPKAGAGGLLGSAMGAVSSGMASVGGTMGEIVATAQGIAFKPQEIKMKFFSRVALQQEPQVEQACYGMTLSALQNTEQVSPFLPVWFIPEPPPAADAPPPPPPKQYAPGIMGDMERKKDEAEAAVAKAKKGVDDKVQDVKDFFAPPASSAPIPGTPFLSLAFGTPAPTGKKSEPMPMELGALACTAFREALGMNSLPSFVESLIKYIMGINLDLLHGGLQSCLARDSGSPILADDLYAGARERLYNKLINLAMDKVSFINTIKNYNTPSVQGMSLSPGGLMDQGTEKIKELIDQKIGHFADIPLKFAIGNLADQLELARQQGVKEKCHTMECYLSRLPWMEATLFFNLFFPFWDAIMDIFIDILGSVLGAPLAAIRKAAGAAKSVVDTGRDALAKASAIQDAVNKGYDLQRDGGPDALAKRFSDASSVTAKSKNGPTLDPGMFIFPLTGRIADCEGKKIEKAELDEVKPKFEWKKAEDPAAPPETSAA